MKKIILFVIGTLFFYEGFSQSNTFPSSGNVGIGTTSPTTKLQIVGGSLMLNNPGGYPYGINIDFDFVGGWAREYSFSYNGSGKLFSFGVYGSDSSLRYGYIGGGSTSGSLVYSNPWMVFLPSGDVGIGTNNPTSKLAVNGEITAQKVKVTQTGWPDFVFDSAYHLSKLSKTEKYLKATHHLPGIPSAKEIESRGLDLGSMEKMQMQKIEELTLYLIHQNKIIEKQSKTIKKLTKRVAQLEQRIK